MVNGVEIENVLVLNRPSYFLVNNYGNEGYMTILEPLEDFRATADKKAMAANYKNLKELVGAFRAKTHIGTAKDGYDRKDTEEVSFMGFTWRWRPNHKSFYGNIREGYELQPLIARWGALTGNIARIDNHDAKYMPLRYKGGTGQGFGGEEIRSTSSNDDAAIAQENAKMVADVESKLSGDEAFENCDVVFPIMHTFFNQITRAAQLNVFSEETIKVYESLMLNSWQPNVKGWSTSNRLNYIIPYTTDTGENKFLGAFYGRKELPSWAEFLIAENTPTTKVTLVNVQANSAEEAESYMQAMLNG